MRVVGAVLAGGLSSRMGSDKALLRLEPDGLTMLEIVAAKLADAVDEVVVVGPSRPELDGAWRRCVPDGIAGIGPLGGIAAALDAAEGDPVIVLSCDMPFVPLPLIQALATDRPELDVLIPQTPGTSRQGREGILQTLCARYGGTSAIAISAAVAAGERRVVSFFSQVSVGTIADADLQRLDPDGWAFFSVNTPEALDLARRRVMDLRPEGA